MEHDLSFNFFFNITESCNFNKDVSTFYIHCHDKWSFSHDDDILKCLKKKKAACHFTEKWKVETSPQRGLYHAGKLFTKQTLAINISLQKNHYHINDVFFFSFTTIHSKNYYKPWVMWSVQHASPCVHATARATVKLWFCKINAHHLANRIWEFNSEVLKL